MVRPDEHRNLAAACSRRYKKAPTASLARRLAISILLPNEAKRLGRLASSTCRLAEPLFLPSYFY